MPALLRLCCSSGVNHRLPREPAEPGAVTEVPAVDVVLTGDHSPCGTPFLDSRDEVSLGDIRASCLFVLRNFPKLVSRNGNFGLVLDRLRRMTVSLSLLEVNLLLKALSCFVNRFKCLSAPASSEPEGVGNAPELSSAGPSTCATSLLGLRNRTEGLLLGGGQEFRREEPSDDNRFRRGFSSEYGVRADGGTRAVR
jgi:hypothetical protein